LGIVTNRADYSVLTYDLRGHGRSGGQRGMFLLTVNILTIRTFYSKERQRFPESPCFLYGHSLGGIIVANYVLQRKPKINGVIITALPHKSSLQEQKGKIAVVKILGSIAPKMPISTGLVPATISKDPEVVSQYINDPLVHHQSSVGWGKSTLESIAWTLQHANEWTLPVLFMHGELDKLGYAEGSREFAGNIECDCSLKIWPNLFHEVHNEPKKSKCSCFYANGSISICP
jgi:alpha-beta hydrolase superfamily lysophospholipase